MTRKDLQEIFNIIGENKDIMLFRKDKTNCRGIAYCGNIALVNGNAIFNGNKYSNIDSLNVALTEWADTLEYPVDTYCPMTREIYRIEERLVWFLTEKMGFKSVRKNWEISYERSLGPEFTLSFYISHDTDSISLLSKYGDYTFTYKVKDAKDGINMISSLVREYALSMASDIVDVVSVCPNTEIADIDAYVKSNNIFGIEQTDYRTTMINLLENELKKLKGE